MDLDARLDGGKVSASTRTPHTCWRSLGSQFAERGRLTIPETLVRDYLRQRYTPRRFGDLYVREGAWSEVFQRDGQVAPPERCRPSGIEDLVDAEEAVKHLSTALYREAIRGPDSVLRLFRNGCRYIMGFPEVTRPWPADSRRLGADPKAPERAP